MKLKLALNIGVPDAKKLGLEKVKAGETVNVKPDVADVLLRNGWAIQTTTDGKEVTDDTPDFDGMTVAELRDYATANGIDGVTTAMNRDETLKAVKKGFNKVR